MASSRLEEAGQGARDLRVRTANIKAGRGSSTAEHKPKPKKAGAPRTASTGGKSPFRLPQQAPRPQARPQGLPTGAIPTPVPRPDGFSPDLAVSPNVYAPGSPVNPNANPMGGVFQGPPIPNFSPDLAVSPNPYAPGSPVNPNANPMGGAFQGPPMPDPRQLAAEQLGAAIGGGPLIQPGRPSGTSPILSPNSGSVVGSGRGPVSSLSPFRLWGG